MYSKNDTYYDFIIFIPRNISTFQVLIEVLKSKLFKEKSTVNWAILVSSYYLLGRRIWPLEDEFGPGNLEYYFNQSCCDFLLGSVVKRLYEIVRSLF